MEDGFEQAAASGLGDSELRLQPITNRHQLIHPRDDATLFREGCEGDCKGTNIVEVQPWLACTICTLNQLVSSPDWGHEAKQKPSGKASFCGSNQSHMLANICLAKVLVEQCWIRDTSPCDDDQEVTLGDPCPSAFGLSGRIDACEAIK